MATIWGFLSPLNLALAQKINNFDFSALFTLTSDDSASEFFWFPSEKNHRR